MGQRNGLDRKKGQTGKYIIVNEFKAELSKDGSVLFLCFSTRKNLRVYLNKLRNFLYGFRHVKALQFILSDEPVQLKNKHLEVAMSARKITRSYCRMTPEERFDYIYKNYEGYDRRIKSFQKGIEFMIKSQKEYNRMKSKGDLGVRVSTSLGLTDKTATEAMENVMIEKCVRNNEITDELLEDLDNVDIVILKIQELQLMRYDYEIFNMILEGIDTEDGILNEYLQNTKTLHDIANVYALSYDGAKSRMHRLKNELAESVIEMMSDYSNKEECFVPFVERDCKDTPKT